MSDKTQFARIVPLTIQEKVAEFVISAVREDVDAMLFSGESDAESTAIRYAASRGRVMNIAMTSLFADLVDKVTQVPALPDDPNSEEGRYGQFASGCDGLRRCGCYKFSAANYTGRNASQLRQLQNEVIEKYMINRDINWLSQQSRLIDAATQVAYKQGRY